MDRNDKSEETKKVLLFCDGESKSAPISQVVRRGMPWFDRKAVVFFYPTTTNTFSLFAAEWGEGGPVNSIGRKEEEVEDTRTQVKEGKNGKCLELLAEACIVNQNNTLDKVFNYFVV